MARQYRGDQVLDAMSGIDTEAETERESEESCYNESDSDDDDSDDIITDASEDDDDDSFGSSSSNDSDSLELYGDDSATHSQCGRVRGRGRRVAGGGRGRGRGAARGWTTGRRRGRRSNVGDVYVWTTVGEGRCRLKTECMSMVESSCMYMYKSTFTPSQEIAVDESVSFKGRVSFRQYLKEKPHPCGIKAFVLSDSKTGYLQSVCVLRQGDSAR